MVKPLHKRDSEIQAFNQFCRILGSFNHEEFDAPDDPDFLRKDGFLAVELVEYHRDQHPFLKACRWALPTLLKSVPFN